MNLTVRFANLFYLALFSAALLFLRWAIGARWGHSATTGYAVFWAIATLLIHDVAMTVVAEQRTDWREVGPTPFG